MAESFQKCCIFHLSHSSRHALHKPTWEENLASRVSPWRAGGSAAPWTKCTLLVSHSCPAVSECSLTACNTSMYVLYVLEEPCTKSSTSSFFSVYIIDLILSCHKSIIFPSDLQTLSIQMCFSHLLVVLDNKEKMNKSLTTEIYWPDQGARILKTLKTDNSIIHSVLLWNLKMEFGHPYHKNRKVTLSVKMFL